MARAGRTVVLVSSLALAACGDDLFDPTWTALPDTAVLFSLARPELELESAFNFSNRTTVPIHRSGAATQWDVALDTRAGQLVLITPNVMGINSRARIAALPGQSYELVVEAPEDTLLYSNLTPVPLRSNTVYVVRTGATTVCSGGSVYAKLEPISIDVAQGRFEFKFDANPYCNDRRLVPPDTT